MRMGGKKNKGRETERKRKTGREHRVRKKEREKEGGSQSLNMSEGKRCLNFCYLDRGSWRLALSYPPYFFCTKTETT